MQVVQTACSIYEFVQKWYIPKTGDDHYSLVKGVPPATLPQFLDKPTMATSSMFFSTLCSGPRSENSTKTSSKRGRPHGCGWKGLTSLSLTFGHCFAMLSHALPCFAMLCHALPSTFGIGLTLLWMVNPGSGLHLLLTPAKPSDRLLGNPTAKVTVAINGGPESDRVPRAPLDYLGLGSTMSRRFTDLVAARSVQSSWGTCR